MLSLTKTKNEHSFKKKLSQNCSRREKQIDSKLIYILLTFIFRFWYSVNTILLLLLLITVNSTVDVAFVMASALNKSVSDAPNKAEETYQLLEQLDHILKRPETYIGSNRPCREVKSIFLSITSIIITFRKCGLLMIQV